MLKMRLFNILIVLALCVSCSEITDFENYYFNTVEQRYEKEFYDRCGSVSSLQNWNTSEQLSLTITLPDMEGNCDVRVLSADPTVSYTKAKLLAEYKDIALGKSHTLFFDAPTYLSSFYVLLISRDKALVEKVDRKGKELTMKVTSITKEADYYFYEDMQYLLAFEDLGIAIDIDFNDVVLCVTHVSGRKQAKVRLYALGTTLYTNVYFNDKPLYDERELHEFYGISNNTLVNAFSPVEVFTNEMRDKSRYLSESFAHNIQTIDLPEGFSIAKDASMFKITTSAYSDAKDNQKKSITLPTESGVVPRGILVANPDWEWPSETVPISVAYPMFCEWASFPDEIIWYK